MLSSLAPASTSGAGSRPLALIAWVASVNCLILEVLDNLGSVCILGGEVKALSVRDYICDGPARLGLALAAKCPHLILDLSVTLLIQQLPDAMIDVRGRFASKLSEGLPLLCADW